MKNKLIHILSLLTILALFLTACNLSSGPSTGEPGEVTQPPVEETGASPIPPLGNTIEILSVTPPLPAGISIADPVTVLVRYDLTIPNGTMQIWFERFTDANCTILGVDPTTGGTTFAGALEEAYGGTHEIAVTFPPLPLLEIAYVGVGVRLWTPDNSTVLVEDMSYAACYIVQEPPADMVFEPSDLTTIPGATAGTGAISGLVFGDYNGNGLLDASEAGGGPYQLVLADVSCSTTLTTTQSAPDGNYAFLGLPPGTYCVIITYPGGMVLPGYFQRVEVVANNISSASFGLQLTSTSPPPVTTGYCGDGVVDTGAGEQCDPPNTIDCTATCQSYVAYCGDGYVDTGAGEQCDPPNLTDCTASCQSYAGYCGNGIVDPSLGEQCDPPNTTDCTASCQTYIAYCGDGYVDTGAGEQCDPPNLTDCTASCQSYVAYCGDGYVDSSAGEQCDPPNIDFCTAQCELYLPNCGNGIIDIGEECDPPNPTDCTAQCQSWP